MPWYNPFSWFRKKPKPRYFETTRIPPVLHDRITGDVTTSSSVENWPAPERKPTPEQLVLRRQAEIQRQRLARAMGAPVKKREERRRTDDDHTDWSFLQGDPGLAARLHRDETAKDEQIFKSGKGGDFAGAGATGSWDDRAKAASIASENVGVLSASSAGSEDYDDSKRRVGMSAVTAMAYEPAPAPSCRASDYGGSYSSDSSSSSSSSDSSSGGGGGGD